MPKAVLVGLVLVAAIASTRDTIELGHPGRWRVPHEAAASGGGAVQHDPAPPWDGGARCAGSFTPGARELGDRLSAAFPQIARVYGYECRPNTARPGETSQHGTGRAIDLAIPTRAGDASNELGDPVANWLVANSQAIGVQLIIWDRTVWVGSLTGTRDLPYAGPDPHVDHIHVELNVAGGARSTDFFRAP